MQNKQCFYVETDDTKMFETFITHMNKEFQKTNKGNVIYSKIHTVFLNKKKGAVNE